MAVGHGQCEVFAYFFTYSLIEINTNNVMTPLGYIYTETPISFWNGTFNIVIISLFEHPSSYARTHQQSYQNASTIKFISE